MKKLMSFLILIAATLFTVQVYAQSLTITGKVVNENNEALPFSTILEIGTKNSVAADQSGNFSIKLTQSKARLKVLYIGYTAKEVDVDGTTSSPVTIVLRAQQALQESVVMSNVTQPTQHAKVMIRGVSTMSNKATPPPAGAYGYYSYADRQEESYASIKDNAFRNVKDEALSTFSIDVDRAAYSNIRRFLNNGQLPPADAVRVEEMVNYFDYKYPAPQTDHPIAVYADMAVCPWNTTHQLVRIGVQGKTIQTEHLPASNIVFLIDVSGSMYSEHKLPLVKRAFQVLINQLREQDRVAIVTYAGAVSVKLPSTSGADKEKIITALQSLEASGGTAGGAGLTLAYETASKYFLKKGNNRIVMATDGDFNLGESSDEAMEKLITKERDKGIYLSVLGFGMGNYKDKKLELLADKGNGNYAYIDNFEEARRTFMTEFGGTLFTIANDVKIQVEFNPKFVQAYRLVGYENRMLNKEDFNDDKKDAGEMGAGHTVTALYEIVPIGASEGRPAVDPLKYQQVTNIGVYNDELLTVKTRYKLPGEMKSNLLSTTLKPTMQTIDQAPRDFRLASAVAEFGLLLRQSQYKAQANYDEVISRAQGAKGDDNEGYCAEFIQLVKKAAILK
ncbi:Ca-activated chloride channel family protein [Chitinophaga skermanii]|uniref:Ca-activated chloride channel family protein n=1 Tax=Chitinophaga skermanii TaxID=331697 RepID=A0A327R4G7_9BACT|nr:von Willebrand factor type A domain-containing protein [Chitinophaga skermanii]RAJ10623.1 Ca-activated chloride channel family protein [Chitinophaga skermanii]